MTDTEMVRLLLFHQVLSNPLPWRVVRDWSHEVIASNGRVIAKCQRHEEAMEIIEKAEKLRQEIEIIEIEVANKISCSGEPAGEKNDPDHRSLGRKDACMK